MFIIQLNEPLKRIWTFQTTTSKNSSTPYKFDPRGTKKKKEKEKRKSQM